MKAWNGQYRGDQHCSKHKGSLQPWIVKEPFSKDNRMIRLTVKSMGQACQTKCSERIRTAKQRAILVISCQKCDHCHRTDHKALQTDFAKEILCQYRFVRSSWFVIHHIAVRRLHAKCDGRKAICQKINKQQVYRCKRNRKSCD